MKSLLVLAVLCFVGCTNESGARQALAAQGMTSVVITGWSPLSCSDSDFSSTGFEATNPQGRTVKGVVCCGMLFKSCTVRW